MYWLDFAIIYFAFGAPFGVFQITAKRELTLPAFFRITSGYVLWPVTAIQSTARFLFTKPAARLAQTNELDAIRAGLEKALFANAAPNDLYAVREVFYRYTGLAAASAEFQMRNAESGDFPSSLIPRPSSLIRSACIARRDRQKLDVQFRAARKDLVEMLRATYHAEIDRTVEALAQCTGDHALINAIHSR